MADIYYKILVCSGSGGYKNLKFVANCVILRRLNKLNQVFILEKKNQLLLVKIILLTVFFKLCFSSKSNFTIFTLKLQNVCQIYIF